MPLTASNSTLPPAKDGVLLRLKTFTMDKLQAYISRLRPWAFPIVAVMGLHDTDYWHGMGYSALRPGLTPLTEAELERRAVLTQRLMRADYFRQADK